MQPATTLENLGVLPQRLEVVDAGDQRTVFLNGHAAARYYCEDKVAERVLLTQLAEGIPLPDRQIAAAFQTHPVALSAVARWLAAAAGKRSTRSYILAIRLLRSDSLFVLFYRKG